LLQHLRADAADDLAKAVVVDRPMVDFRAIVFAQADEHHLHQATLYVPHEVRVWFDAAADHDVIGLEGEAIEMHREALGRLADDAGFHRGPTRAAQVGLGHAVAGQNCPLTFDRPAAVTSHRRHDEGLGPEALQMLNDGLDDDVDVRDPATAAGDRHALARLD